MVCFLGVVKPVAPLLAENGCFSGETARRWCHRFRLRAVGVVTVVLPVSIEGQMVVTVVPLVACERSVVLSVVSPVSCEHS